jgi:hypothetical protein
METSKEIATSGGILASRRALLAGVGLGVGSLALPFGALPAAAQEADIEVIVIGSSPDDTGMIGGAEDILLQTKLWALDMSNKLLAGGSVLVCIGGVAVWTGVGGFAGVGLVTAGGIAMMLSFWLHQYALDPPQAGYTQAAALNPMNVKYTGPQLTAIPALGQLAKSGNMLVPTGKCMLDSLERYYGAKLAGDAAWQLRQRIGHDQLAALMSFHLGQYSRGLTGMSGKLKINPAVNPTVMSDFLTQYQDPAKKAQLQSVLTSAGFTPADIVIIETQLQQVVPANVTSALTKTYISNLSKDTKAGGVKLADLLFRFA